MKSIPSSGAEGREWGNVLLTLLTIIPFAPSASESKFEVEPENSKALYRRALALRGLERTEEAERDLMMAWQVPFFGGRNVFCGKILEGNMVY